MGGIRRLERSVERHKGVTKARRPDVAVIRRRAARRHEAAALRGERGIGAMLVALAAMVRRPFWRRAA